MVLYKVSMKRKGNHRNLHSLPRLGEEPLDPRPISTKVTPEIAQLVRSLPNPSAWVREVITEAAQRDLLGKEEGN
jgi:hypothetical protein